MRRTRLVAGFCIAGLMMVSQPANAFDRATGLRSAAVSDLSAARKKKHKQRVQKQRVYVRQAPQAGHVRGPWMDPSLGPDGRPYPNPYPPNTCSTDLGYGRFSTCDFHE